SNYLSMAERENIEFLTDIQVSFSNIQIDDYDFSIILGNLLDNSLEACREIQFPFPRQIAVSIHTSSRELLIHIYNSISKQKKENSKDELKHGYGTANIENITLKYYGTYTHYIEKDRYHAIVSIPCNIPE
ncbi:MAG: GHKL domain-containing protein, partial [Eubacterium sp.]|nr:GHKL domain-containing protein [Eubacterium sp.]